MSIHVGEAIPVAVSLAQIGGHVVTPRPDCVIWTSDGDRGYGKVKVNGQTKRVHRVVWELTHGPIPDGLTVDHLCRVRSCVNTEHMELVTVRENVLRGSRGDATHCKRGHEYTPENTRLDRHGWRICRACRRMHEGKAPPS